MPRAFILTSSPLAHFHRIADARVRQIRERDGIHCERRRHRSAAVRGRDPEPARDVRGGRPPRRELEKRLGDHLSVGRVPVHHPPRLGLL
eukprot:31499-Pelagococcus_subviridis.AAC.11